MFLGLFSYSYEVWPKSMYRSAQTKNLPVGHFDLVTSDNINSTKGRQRFRKISESVPYTIYAVSSALFPFDTTNFPGEADKDRVSKIWAV